jgi:hypothetical protein
MIEEHTHFAQIRSFGCFWEKFLWASAKPGQNTIPWYAKPLTARENNKIGLSRIIK